MEREIGEIFEYNGIRLKVVGCNISKGCDPCYFHGRQDCLGNCTYGKRSDKNCIVYKQTIRPVNNLQ